MKPLNQEYLDELALIKTDIQASEILAKYLDEEEEEDYLALREAFEPRIAVLYKKVAENNPLQLVTFERELLNDQYEGMFITRILGFAVLRGEINDNCKYIRPQSHFKDVLMAVCGSSNFDIIRKRIGQTIQMGFSMSSDIWITNLINVIANKKIRYFLQGQKNPKFRDLKERNIALARYKNQFRNENFFACDFPTNLTELKIQFSEVKLFLKQRIHLTGDNSRDVVSFGTEAGLFQEIGISTVVCGPGSIEQAHKVDEFITLDQIKKCLILLNDIKKNSNSN